MEERIYSSPEEARRARRYQMRRLAWGVAGALFEFGVTVGFVLAARTGDWGGHPFWAGMSYFALLASVRLLVGLPFDWAESYRLPHEVGLSRETPAGWLADRAKGWLLTLAIGGVAAGTFLWVAALRPGDWWWVAALLGGALGLVLVVLGPVVLAPLFFRFRPLGDPELRRRLEALLVRTGARVRGGVWEMDMSRKSRAANAALVGWGPSRRVVLSDTLLEYAPEEIEAVLAHELAHHVGRHIPGLLAIRFVALAAGLYLAQHLLARPDWLAWIGWAPPAPVDPTLIGFVWIFFTLYGALLSPLMLAVSRRLEYWCDHFAVRHTGGGGGMASALARLGRKNLADPEPPGWVVALFHSHPPIRRRIARAREAAEAAAGAGGV